MKKTLAENIYEKLLMRLLMNEYVPGEFLNRRTIAEEMGVSVAPVMEAMLRLKSEGFLENISRVGTRVRLFKKDVILGHLILREALECQAARIYCGPCIKSNLNSLLKEAVLLDMIPEGTPEDFREEIRFHTKLVNLTGCGPLTEEFMRIANISLFCSLNRLPAIGVPVVKNNHKNLVESLLVDDEDKAENIMREHLRKGKGNIFNQA